MLRVQLTQCNWSPCSSGGGSGTHTEKRLHEQAKPQVMGQASEEATSAKTLDFQIPEPQKTKYLLLKPLGILLQQPQKANMRQHDIYLYEHSSFPINLFSKRSKLRNKQHKLFFLIQCMMQKRQKPHLETKILSSEISRKEELRNRPKNMILQMD